MPPDSDRDNAWRYDRVDGQGMAETEHSFARIPRTRTGMSMSTKKRAGHSCSKLSKGRKCAAIHELKSKASLALLEGLLQETY